MENAVAALQSALSSATILLLFFSFKNLDIKSSSDLNFNSYVNDLIYFILKMKEEEEDTILIITKVSKHFSDSDVTFIIFPSAFYCLLSR